MGNEEFDLCMSRIRNGDKEALHEIYNAYAGYLFHMVLGIVGNYQDAEDIAEEVVSDMNVEQVLNLLKPAEREIVHLKVIGEQTFERIAAILQLPLGTVTWRYRQAITKLRRCGYEA